MRTPAPGSGRGLFVVEGSAYASLGALPGPRSPPIRSMFPAAPNPGLPELVVKVYGPGRPGLGQEAEVYRRIGSHPAYSECIHVGDGYLVLRRLHGIALYDCMAAT
jgi:hypothetical protein